VLGDESYLDAADRWVDDWQARIEERAARARAAAQRMRDLTGQATGGGGLVTVTVSSSGALVDLRLDEQVRRHSAKWIADQIMATAREAMADLAGHASAAVEETVGRESADGQALLRAFGQPSRERS
jgi:DNA-binding protein YbaB